ncbi:hypothetical protein ACP4OV_015782 [Aristida adscensionis]
MRSLAAILFVLATVAAGAASAARFEDLPVADMPKGTSPTQIGRFAVLVYGMNRGSKLKLVGVPSIERRRDMGGFRFKLELTAVNAGTGQTASYRADVWGVPGTYQWMLLDFKPIH